MENNLKSPIKTNIFRMAEEFTVDKMKDAAEKGDWGTNAAKGEHFYRALFRTEKKPVMTMADVKILFASYNEWIKDTKVLIKNCEESWTREDKNAIQAANKLILDVTDHLHQIITKVQCEDKDLIAKLIKTADEMN